MDMLKMAFKAFALFCFQLFSVRDYMLFAGLVLTGLGAHMIYPPAAYLIPGLILMAVAILASQTGGRS